MPLNPIGERRDAARTLTAGRGTVVPYDFRRPSKLSRENVRLLQATVETFARRLTTLLTSGLRHVCHVTPTDISQQSYEEYVTSRAPATLMVPVTLPQLPGTGVLEFSLPAALAAIDHMLGGPGGTQPTRQLTDIETTLVTGLLEQMVGVLRYALEPIVAVQPALGPIEYNSQFVQAAGATDAVLVCLFAMSIGSEQCELSLCLPLAPLLPKLMAQRAREDRAGNEAVDAAGTGLLRDRLGDLPIELAVQFPPVRLSPDRILSLAVGDVLTLDHRVGLPLAVRVGGVTFAGAIAGRAGTRLAALVTETPQEQA